MRLGRAGYFCWRHPAVCAIQHYWPARFVFPREGSISWLINLYWGQYLMLCLRLEIYLMSKALLGDARKPLRKPVFLQPLRHFFSKLQGRDGKSLSKAHWWLHLRTCMQEFRHHSDHIAFSGLLDRMDHRMDHGTCKVLAFLFGRRGFQDALSHWKAKSSDAFGNTSDVRLICVASSASLMAPSVKANISASLRASPKWRQCQTLRPVLFQAVFYCDFGAVNASRGQVGQEWFFFLGIPCAEKAGPNPVRAMCPIQKQETSLRERRCSLAWCMAGWVFVSHNSWATLLWHMAGSDGMAKIHKPTGRYQVDMLRWWQW